MAKQLSAKQLKDLSAAPKPNDSDMAQIAKAAVAMAADKPAPEKTFDAYTAKAWQQLMAQLAAAWRQEAAKIEALPGTEKTVALMQRFAASIEQTAQRGPETGKR